MSIVDNAKEIASLVKKIGDVELYRKIVELEGEIIELTRTNRELEDNLSNLSRSQDIIETLKFDSPFYISENGDELYCARCIESEQIAIHLADTGNKNLRRSIWECPQCKSQYVDTRAI